jgi:glutathione S-transferase
MYSRQLDTDGKAPVVLARGNFLREQRSKYPDRAAVLDARIAGNEKLQAVLANPSEIARHVDEARLLVSRIDDALSHTRFVSDDSYTLADTFATAALARFRLQGFEEWWSGGANAKVAGGCESVPIGLRPESSTPGVKAICRSILPAAGVPAAWRNVADWH